MAGSDATIDVQGPPGHAFEVWAAFREHARFLKGIRSVERRGDRLHVVGQLGLRTVAWDADVVVEEAPWRIAWSAPDGPLDTEVTLEPLEEGTSTRVRVRQRVHGAAPFGAAHLVLLRSRGDLKRYKAVVEGGTAVGMSW